MMYYNYYKYNRISEYEVPTRRGSRIEREAINKYNTNNL